MLRFMLCLFDNRGLFTYYIIADGVLWLITLNVTVSQYDSVKFITGGAGKNRTKIYYVICEQSPGKDTFYFPDQVISEIFCLQK